MAVQAQFAGCFPGGGVEEQLFADGALLSAAANNWFLHCPPAGVVSGAQSELTCNGSGGVPYSRKRGREAADHLEQQYAVTSSSLLPLPIPAAMRTTVSCRVGAESDSVAAAVSTSGRRTCRLPAAAAQEEDASLSELCRRQRAEVDALVRAGWARLRAGLERAQRKRQRLELVAAVERLRAAEAALDAARRRAAELEERLRQAAAESQAWCRVARGHEAVTAELRAALEQVLATTRSSARAAEEGFGDSSSDPACCAPAAGVEADDALSCCFVPPVTTDRRWACKACGEREASVLVLPCRHLGLCKACEPRADACPVCLAVKNASIHVAAD